MAQAGDNIPGDITLWTIRPGSEAPEQVSTDAIFKGRKVALFAVPGAFTPGCSKTHCPSFVRGSKLLKEKGIDEVVCTAVNDPFVMSAWAEHQNAVGKITFYADPAGAFAKALKYDSEMPAGRPIAGTRSKRYGMLVDNGVITHVGLDAPGQIVNSTAEALLAVLDGKDVQAQL